MKTKGCSPFNSAEQVPFQALHASASDSLSVPSKGRTEPSPIKLKIDKDRLTRA